MPFDHPLHVLFYSGTNGAPKPITHGHGGILLDHLKDHALHDWPLQQIAERLNFSHSEYMGVAFKKHTGPSPGQYRRTLNGPIARQAFWQECPAPRTDRVDTSDGNVSAAASPGSPPKAPPPTG